MRLINLAGVSTRAGEMNPYGPAGLLYEDVNSGVFHGHIPWTAIIPRVRRIAVTGGSLFVSPRGVQYCPEPRIPLNHSTGFPGRMPGEARAAVPGASGPAESSAIFAWCVFMAVFLFTDVNTEYEAGRVIYPDFASGFAAIFLSSIKKG
jgi:hypothetical protein